MKALNWIALILILIGALNWGLVGVFHFDLVAYLLKPMSLWTRATYSVIGVAAVVYILSALRKS